MVDKWLEQDFSQLAGQAFERLKSFVESLTALKLTRFFLVSFLVLFPFQIRTLVFQMPFTPTGNFNEYTAFFLHLSDLALVATFLAFGVALYKGEVKEIHYGSWPVTLSLLLFLGLIMASIPLSAFPVVGFWKFLRFLEFFGLYLLLVNQILSRRQVLLFFIGGMLFQSFLAFLQYLFQSSIGLHFLGEVHLSPQELGVAKVDFNGGKYLRAYGTFSHPNVLGGLVAMALLWSYALFRKRMIPFLGIGAFLIVGLLLSFSRSAFLAIGGGVLFFISLTDKKIRFQNVLLWGSVVLFLIVLFNLQDVLFDRLFLGNDPNATVERLEYLDAGKRMLMAYPFGTGLGHFTLMMQDFMVQSADPWLLQPVHNVVLLIMNEAGIITGAVFVGLFCVLFVQLLRGLKTKNDDEKAFASIAIAILGVIALIMLFDHYFFTIYAGQAALFLYLGVVSDSFNKDLLPRKKS